MGVVVLRERMVNREYGGVNAIVDSTAMASSMEGNESENEGFSSCLMNTTTSVDVTADLSNEMKDPMIQLMTRLLVIFDGNG